MSIKMYNGLDMLFSGSFQRPNTSLKSVPRAVKENFLLSD